MKIKDETKTTVIKKRHMTLRNSDIVSLLQKEGHDVPNDATVQFTVPGGGDWSNCDLDVCKENPIEVSWTETEENSSDDEERTEYVSFVGSDPKVLFTVDEESFDWPWYGR